MMRMCKSKKVSWASDVNLCQVRLFLSEDAPSQSGFGIQEQLQAKSSWLLHSTGMGSDDHPPPGFEGPNPNLPQIALVKWICPPTLVLDPDWGVVAGEESKEADFQNKRELRVLEAVYPRLSSIPASPSDSSDLHICHNDDSQTPLIPVTTIEDDDATDFIDSASPIRTLEGYHTQCLSNILLACGTSDPPTSGSGLKSQGNGSDFPTPNADEKPAIGPFLGVEPDVMAAASAAFTAIMRSSEEGSLIDHDLLIKILSNPKVLEKLVSEYGMASNQRSPTNPSEAMPMPMSKCNPQTSPAPSLGQLNHPMTNTKLPALNSPSSNLPPPNVIQSPIASVTVPVKAATRTKDASYYKTLIQRHGEERNEAQDPTSAQFIQRQASVPSVKPREFKSKFQKPCIYFNSPNGCRNGASCLFQHDAPSRIRSVPEGRGSKRIKLEREQLTTGRS